MVISKPTPPIEGEESLYEHYEEGENNNRECQDDNWWGQTFPPQVSHTISKVSLKVYREGSPGDVVVSIRNTLDGKPTGGDLCIATVNGNDFLATPPGRWEDIKFPTGASLNESVLYAIGVRAPDGDWDNSIHWRGDYQAPQYTRGTAVNSANSGISWTVQATWDMMFREYGKTAGQAGEAGLLHVRHPALMSIVHKRGELTINGYDTLSSLDNEYLTGQAGLDVLSGDIIKATTLPGIDYHYEVV